jgi:gliding motility-associated-like protein
LLRLISIGVLCFLFTVCNVQAQIIDTVCIGYTNVPYAVDRHQGSTYKWVVEGGDIASGAGTNRITVNWKKQPGTFRLSVVEINETNCAGDSVFAYVLVRGSNFKTQHPNKACLFDSVTVKASGGLWYNWGNGATDSIFRFNIERDTVLTVLISDTACGLRTDTLSMNIKAVTKPTVSFTTEADEFYINQSMFFTYGGGSNDNVTWNIDKTNRGQIKGPAVNVTFIDTGEAYVKVLSVNTLGCKDSLSRLINIKDEQLYFPTAFTPNADGLNDTFKPGGIGIKTYYMAVYNRWGQKVFETHDLKTGWDGTYNGQPVDSETYIYQCDAHGYSGRLYTHNGNITILR